MGFFFTKNMKFDFDKTLAILLPLTWIFALLFGIENWWSRLPFSFCVGAAIPRLWKINDMVIHELWKQEMNYKMQKLKEKTELDEEMKKFHMGFAYRKKDDN